MGLVFKIIAHGLFFQQWILNNIVLRIGHEHLAADYHYGRCRLNQAFINQISVRIFFDFVGTSATILIIDEVENQLGFPLEPADVFIPVGELHAEFDAAFADYVLERD